MALFKPATLSKLGKLPAETVESGTRCVPPPATAPTHVKRALASEIISFRCDQVNYPHAKNAVRPARNH
eukprot:8880499-Pyramimonas_sp.AAC.1